jgi:hypothetical protein
MIWESLHDIELQYACHFIASSKRGFRSNICDTVSNKTSYYLKRPWHKSFTQNTKECALYI